MKPTKVETMKVARCGRQGAHWVLITWCSQLLAATCFAGEPAMKFVQGLRDRGYHDMALEYLERMSSSRLAPEDFSDTILYEQGITLIDASRYQRNSKLQQQQLDEAQAKFQQFVTQHPDHPLAASAASQMANVLIERARMSMASVEKSGSAAAKEQYRAEAGDLFARAREQFQRRYEAIRVRLTEIPKQLDPKREAALIEERDRLRAEYVQAQLVIATITYEMAATAGDDKRAREKLLLEAADAFGEIAEKYRRLLAGLYSVLYRGRCYQDMGDCKKALNFYQELLEQPDQPEEFRTLKLMALQRAMQCWIDSSIQQYDAAIAAGDQWIRGASQHELNGEDGLAVRWWLARANQLKANSPDGDKKESRQLLASARKQARVVAQQSRQFGQNAKEMLAHLQGTEEPDQAKPDPQTFTEASDAGRDSLQRMESSSVLIRLVQPKIDQTEDAQRKAEMQQQIAEAERSIGEHRGDATRFFRLALQLADEKTPLEDLNLVRYYLCYLDYVQEHYFEAAVLGEFLARRYPDASGARQGAKIAMASYVRLYGESTDEDKSFETEHIIGIADYVTRRWPGQSEVEDALVTLVDFMIKQGSLDKAEEYLAKIPEESTRRADAELRTGQALWGQYLRGMQSLLSAEDADPAAADTSRLDEIKARAEKILSSGIERMRQGERNATLVRAVLSLSQIYVDTGDPARALQLLDDPEIGARTLADQNDPLTRAEGVAEETYKTALRALIASLPDADDPDSIVNDAVAVMGSLEKVVGDTPEGKNQLMSIYVSLAGDLKRQMEIAPASTKQSLSKGFESFLSLVGRDATDINVLNWAAESFYSLGEGFAGGRSELTAEARRYFEQAATAYQRILDAAAQGTLSIDPQMKTQVRMRLASSQRRLHNFKAAIDMFESILQENNMLVNVQVEAARTFQDWAAVDKAENYTLAIRGDRLDKKTNKNTIWGWSKLATIAAQQMYRGPEYKEKYRDTFHEARYNMARARYEQAMRRSGSAQKQYLKRAEIVISSTFGLYPDLGGEAWQPKYDALLKRIQKNLGQETNGLEALKTQSNDSASGRRRQNLARRTA